MPRLTIEDDPDDQPPRLVRIDTDADRWWPLTLADAWPGPVTYALARRFLHQEIARRVAAELPDLDVDLRTWLRESPRCPEESADLGAVPRNERTDFLNPDTSSAAGNPRDDFPFPESEF